MTRLSSRSEQWSTTSRASAWARILRPGVCHFSCRISGPLRIAIVGRSSGRLLRITLSFRLERNGLLTRRERYRWLLHGVRELSTDNNEFETTTAWWNKVKPMFLDEALMDRTVFGFDQDVPAEERETNARVLVSVAEYWGKQLVEEVSAALGRKLKTTKPSLEWKKDNPRGDLWVDWWSKEAKGLGIRVWVNNRGAAVALRPGLIRKGWRKEVAPLLESANYPGCRVLGGSSSMIGEDVGLGGINWAEFVYGRWFEREQFTEVDLATTVVEVSELLKPLFEELLNLALGRSGEASSPVPSLDDPLSPFVEEYLAESGYPTPADEKHRSERRQFAVMLAPDALFEIGGLRRIHSD